MPKKKSEQVKVSEGQEADTPDFKMGKILMWVVIGIGLYFMFNKLIDFDLIGSVIFALAIAVPGLIITDPSLNNVEKQRVWVIFILCFFVIFFWSAFEQAGASLTFFAEEQTDRNLMGWEMPASWFQSFNAIFIVIFAPIFAWIWAKLGAANREPSSPLKMSIGLFLLSIGYLVIAFGVKGVDPEVKVGMMWLTSLYLLHTFGELCLSPIGLSIVTKLAPLRFSSLLMGTWFLANSASNKFAGTLSSLYPPGPAEFAKAQEKGIDLQGILSGAVTATQEQIDILKTSKIPFEFPTMMGMEVTNLYEFFMIFVVMSAVASLILFIIYKWLSRMMHGVH